MKFLFLVILILGVEMSWCQDINYFRQTSIVFAIASQETYIETTCQLQLKEIKDAILRKDAWAIKVLDSSAQKSPGFIYGNGFWLGSVHGCSTVQTPLKISLSSRFKRHMKDDLISSVAPFDMEYKVVHLTSNSPWQIDYKVKADPVLHLGLCLPKSCSNEEVFRTMQAAISNGLIADFDFLEFEPKVLKVKDLSWSYTIITRTSFILLLGITFATLTMFMISKSRFTNRFATFFDISSHRKSLFKIEYNQESSIPVINGYKTLLCSLIAFSHVFYFTHFRMNNKGLFLSAMEATKFQLFTQTHILVEGFFVISGFLSCHNFLKNQKQMDELRKAKLIECPAKYWRMIMSRYFRLLPLYLVALLVTDFTSAYSNDVSLFHLEERFHETCPKYWWRNIIFIQNLFNHRELCMGWSWSTACEMQFFSLVTLMLFVYARHEFSGKCLLIISWIFAQAWFMVSAFKVRYTFEIDVMVETTRPIYMNPVYRFEPYFWGTVTAWLLNTHKTFFLSMSQKTENQVWMLATVLFVVVIFIEVDRSWSTIPSIIISIIAHHANSFNVCWLILASATGKRIRITRILEHPVFQHFSKLTYGMYLLNPVLISFLFSLNQSSTNFDLPLLMVVCFGILLMTYVLSIRFHLLFEAPYLKMANTYFDGKRRLA